MKTFVLSPSQHCLYLEVINYFGKKGSKILNTAPRLLETGEDFRFVPFVTLMIPF